MCIRDSTKSGVVGLLAAALGLRRDDTEGLARLNGLRFACLLYTSRCV